MNNYNSDVLKGNDFADMGGATLPQVKLPSLLKHYFKLLLLTLISLSILIIMAGNGFAAGYFATGGSCSTDSTQYLVPMTTFDDNPFVNSNTYKSGYASGGALNYFGYNDVNKSIYTYQTRSAWTKFWLGFNKTTLHSNYTGNQSWTMEYEFFMTSYSSGPQWNTGVGYNNQSSYTGVGSRSHITTQMGAGAAVNTWIDATSTDGTQEQVGAEDNPTLSSGRFYVIMRWNYTTKQLRKVVLNSARTQILNSSIGLTGTTWNADSIIVYGIDASSAGNINVSIDNMVAYPDNGDGCPSAGAPPPPPTSLTATNIVTNTTTYSAETNVMFNTTWVSDGGILSKWVFSINDTGSWVNSTPFVLFTSSNISSKTYTLAAGLANATKVGWRFYANDTNYMVDSGIQTITIINPNPAFPPVLSNITYINVTNSPIPDANITCIVTDANCSSMKWSVNSNAAFYSLTGANEKGWGYCTKIGNGANPSTWNCRILNGLNFSSTTALANIYFVANTTLDGNNTSPALTGTFNYSITNYNYGNAGSILYETNSTTMTYSFVDLANRSSNTVYLVWNGTQYSYTTRTQNNGIWNFSFTFNVPLWQTNNTNSTYSFNHTAVYNFSLTKRNLQNGFSQTVLWNYFISAYNFVSTALETVQGYNYQVLVHNVSNGNANYNVIGFIDNTQLVFLQNGNTWYNTTNIPLQSNLSTSYLYNSTLNVSYGSVTYQRSNIQNTLTVYQFQFSNCSGGVNTLTLTLNLNNEDDNNNMSGSIIQGNFIYFVNDSSQTTAYKNHSFYLSYGTDNSTFCIYPSNANIQATGFLIYNNPATVTRTYYVPNTHYTSTSQSLALYLLNTTLNTDVTFSFADLNDEPLENYYIKLMRYFPGQGGTTSSGIYTTVELGKTDSNGQIKGHIRLNDYFYKILVISGTTIIKEYSAAKILSNSVNFQIDITGNPLDDFTNYGLVQSALSFNNNTGIAIFTVSDNSMLARTICIKGLKRTGFGDTILCNSCDTNTATTLTCSGLLNQSGQIIIEGYLLTANSTKYTLNTITYSYETYFQNMKSSGSNYLFLLAFIGLGFVGIWNPNVLIVMSFLGIALGTLLGLFQIAFASIVLIGIATAFYVIKNKV